MTSSTPKESRPARKRRTQEERRAETSAKLLAAAIDLLLEKGYSRFRIADTAARAGMSRGAQTHHFSTKNDLIEAAIDQLFESEVGQAQIEAANTPDAEVIPKAARHAGDFLTSKLYQVSLKMLISVGELEHLADGVRGISARSRVPIEDAWISRIAQSGVSRNEAEAVLGLLWSVQRGLAVERYIGGDCDDLGNELDFTMDLLAGHLRNEEEPAVQ